MRMFIALALSLTACLSAKAEIVVKMDGWDVIPRVVVSVGRNADCGQNPVRFDSSARRGDELGRYPEAGSSGVDVCWKRTADPFNSSSPLQPYWTRCSSDGLCLVS